MAQKKLIIIVEDESEIANLVSDYLISSGFSTLIIADGVEAAPLIKLKNPALVLLDIMLPNKNGLEILKEIRQFCEVPVIMVTARIDEIDRLIGLNTGADDYICKPFSPRELVARVNAVLRRVSKENEKEIIEAGDIILDTIKRICFICRQEIILTPTEFNILKIMINHPERVFSRIELLEMAMGYDYDGYDRVIDSHIKNLRRKITLVAPNRDIISSVYGTGYRFSLK